MASGSRFWYFTRKKFSKDGKVEKEQSRKIFVGDLDDQTTERTLREYFRRWGVIKNCKIVKRQSTRIQSEHQAESPRIFGFVTFTEPYMVDATQAARPHKIDGQIVETKRAIPQKDLGKPEANMKVNKLFVGALKADVEVNDLKEYFTQFGNIVNINIETEGESSGEEGRFSHIEFDDYDPVDKVLLETHFIKGHQVEVKKALSFEQMNIVEKKRKRKSSGGHWKSSGGPVRRGRGFSRRNAGPYGS